MTPIEHLKAQEEQKQPWIWFHWQNLNDKKGGVQGSGLRHGRCWWHFRTRSKGCGPSIEFSWNLWSSFCGIGVDFDDEDMTLGIALPPIALWLSFSTAFRFIHWLSPKKSLGDNYPGVIVVDQRDCSIRIHNGCLWIHPWSKSIDWVKADPWWVRGISLPLNPFEARHQRHEVRRSDGTWVPYVGSWERDKEPDGKEEMTFPYQYTLKNGQVQERMVTVFVDRRSWRPKCLQWTSLFEKSITSIDVQFSDEVGEKSGSWKGGCVGCGYTLLANETAEQCLRRMERERKF